MKGLRTVSILLVFAASMGLGRIDPAEARNLSFRECQALNLAAAKGRRVGHGQQGRVNAVVQECMHRYGQHLSTNEEARIRRRDPRAELLGDMLDIIGSPDPSHGKRHRKGHHY